MQLNNPQHWKALSKRLDKISDAKGKLHPRNASDKRIIAKLVEMRDAGHKLFEHYIGPNGEQL